MWPTERSDKKSQFCFTKYSGCAQAEIAHGKCVLATQQGGSRSDASLNCGAGESIYPQTSRCTGTLSQALLLYTSHSFSLGLSFAYVQRCNAWSSWSIVQEVDSQEVADRER